MYVKQKSSHLAINWNGPLISEGRIVRSEASLHQELWHSTEKLQMQELTDAKSLKRYTDEPGLR